jgi:RNA polymerase sigma-70 factor, ECF subfamily
LHESSKRPIQGVGGAEHISVMSSPIIDVSTSTRDEWMKAWSSNRAQMMDEVYRLHAAAIHLRARSVCGAEDAADVTQEVLLRLWRNPDGFDPTKGSLRTYLLVLAHGVAIDVVRSTERRRRRDERALPSLASGEHLGDRIIFEPVLRHETAVRVNAALGQLDPRHRRAIQSRFFDDISFGEAARRDGVPEGTVKSRVRLGLQRLRPVLADLHDGGQKKHHLMRPVRSSEWLDWQ